MIDNSSLRARYLPQIAAYQTKSPQSFRHTDGRFLALESNLSQCDGQIGSYPTGSEISVILHFGRVHLLNSYDSLLERVSLYGKILEFQEVSDDERRSLRVNLATCVASIRKLRQDISSMFPMIRVKQISSSESYKKKVYLKIHLSHTKAALIEYFSQFGEVKKIELKYDPKSKVPRNFCYLTFSKSESVLRACSLKEHLVSSKIVYCQPYRQYEIQNGEDQPLVIEVEPATNARGSNKLCSLPESCSESRTDLLSADFGQKTSDHLQVRFDGKRKQTISEIPRDKPHVGLRRENPRSPDFGQSDTKSRLEGAFIDSCSGSTQQFSTSPQNLSPFVEPHSSHQTKLRGIRTGSASEKQCTAARLGVSKEHASSREDPLYMSLGDVMTTHPSWRNMAVPISARHLAVDTFLRFNLKPGPVRPATF